MRRRRSRTACATETWRLNSQTPGIGSPALMRLNACSVIVLTSCVRMTRLSAAAHANFRITLPAGSGLLCADDVKIRTTAHQSSGYIVVEVLVRQPTKTRHSGSGFVDQVRRTSNRSRMPSGCARRSFVARTSADEFWRSSRCDATSCGWRSAYPVTLYTWPSLRAKCVRGSLRGRRLMDSRLRQQRSITTIPTHRKKYSGKE